MRILLSNDDGILAPGLAALYAAVADLGEVTVAAPASPQSAVGHSITVRQPMTVQRVHVQEGSADFHGFSVDGRPADCAHLAITKLLDAPPDLVLSGINSGANVGIHVFYSGTVAAAAEGAICGIPSVAFSADLAGGELDFPRLGALCRWTLDRLWAEGLDPGDLISVNLPALGEGLPKGVRTVPQSTADVIEIYDHQLAPDGLESYERRECAFADAHDGTDVKCLQDGYITVTPLHVDRTNRARLEALARSAWPAPPT